MYEVTYLVGKAKRLACIRNLPSLEAAKAAIQGSRVTQATGFKIWLGDKLVA